MIKIEFLNTTIPTDKFGFAVTPEDSFKDALTTKKGSVICSPYGTDFAKRKHRNLDDFTLIDIRRDFAEACSYDPRLQFENVEYELEELSIGRVGFKVFLNVGIIEGRLVA